ncbi:MAG: pantoate--beta-alanine ligase [Gammaproteobacteria bacterium]|nr:pantoate--beta-alanine ligase [Gammaproteobacteria bacterium]
MSKIVIRSIDEWRRFRAALTGSLGFVPTLGGLHEGHAALIQRAAAENDLAVVSLFLNPTQFDDPGDLASYPASLEDDLAYAEAQGASAVLAPDREAIYADGFRFKVEESPLSRELCGAHRPGHFSGVLTVVLKLLNLVKPDRAYFGEKDYQQLELIRGMAEAFFIDSQIVACPTVRDADGLALSSRNARLDAAGRALAPRLREALASPGSDGQVAEALSRLGFDVDYVATRFGRRLAAASIGNGQGRVRLIDNMPLAQIRAASDANGDNPS